VSGVKARHLLVHGTGDDNTSVHLFNSLTRFLRENL
jgi:dipeptidyl aminopeptidase/acylaminoacyl peptidase